MFASVARLVTISVVLFGLSATVQGQGPEPSAPLPAFPSVAEATPPAADAASAALGALSPEERKAIEAVVGDILKKRDADKKKADEEKKKADEAKKKHEADVKRGEFNWNLDAIRDTFARDTSDKKKWYDKLSWRGYTQVRFGRTLDQEIPGGEPNLFGDRTINGNAENFLIRRARLIISGDVSDEVYIYIQPDFASTPQGSTNSTLFGQLRDAYCDYHFDKEKVHRLRVGLQKVPYAFENLQSSQNRVPLDRTDAMNTAVAPNERDLGVVYYWTPVEYQQLFKALVDGGLKGSGNYGIFGLGVYDGQGGSVTESNLNLHTVARFTLPYQFANGQVIEGGVQGYRGDYVVSGAQIRALGKGNAITPTNTGGTRGILEERAAATFVFYPQPFGFQAEWQTGRGPGLNDAQTSVIRRNIDGGYVMGMYRHETECWGIFTPYCRYQQFTGGYRNIANAPYGHQRQVDLGVEWQIRKAIELVVEYSHVNTPNFTARNVANTQSYLDFEGNTLRVQMQFNY